MVRKPNKYVIKYGELISRYAHMRWVTPFFFIIFFLDSFLMFIPAEGLMAVSLLFAKDKKKVWYTVSVIGATLGFILFLFLILSQFQHLVIEYIVEHDHNKTFQEIVIHASKYGYYDLTLATITILPQIIFLAAGIVLGLNPFIILFIACIAKAFRIWLVVFVTEKFYAAAIYLSHKMHFGENKGDSLPLY